MTDPRNIELEVTPRTQEALPRLRTPIVPRNSIAGRSLVAVVAIMTFLASMTTGAVVLVRTAASDWQAEVAREITIQVRPQTGRDVEAEVRKAADIARAAPGVADVRPYTKEESSRLLEPWLGSGLALDDLPIPRMIVVKVAPDVTPDLASLRKTLSDQVAGASIDDHRGWIEQMRTMSRTAVGAGIVILLLVFAATVLSVTFATRGAIASNRPVVEVLHFIGAPDSFIARHFQRHFLWLGLKGGALGGGAAILLFALAELVSSWLTGGAGADRVSALFGTFSIGTAGYVAVAVQVIVVAVLIAATSRQTVNRTLQSLE
ncbi:MAG: cell division transport system permease protein [Alphaproteobacteria bacterium]|jgi:cell division transport system permease protein|nr:cell division transport system permease protein [Alphaproteobacteria bacterium]